MCKHIGLVVGNLYRVSLNNATCGHCGSPATLGIDGIYMGHDVFDGVQCGVFSLKRFSCPGCGLEITSSRDPCDGGNYYQLEAIEAIGWPIKQETTNGNRD